MNSHLHNHKRILVAGGAGFIGSHMCDRLVREGHEVLCLDNLYTGRMENIQKLLDNPNFSYVNYDVTIPFSYNDVSFIINLACPASPIHYQKDAIYTTKTAVLGTLNMLELARKNQWYCVDYEGYSGTCNWVNVESCCKCTVVYIPYVKPVK